MTKADLAKIATNLKVSLVKHSPEILTGIGIAGMVATTVLAVRATPKALRCIADAEDEKQDPLTPVETVKTCWKCYIPATVTGVASIACLVGGSTVSNKRNAALAAAYTLSDTALREYREKVVETIGEKKEQAVRDAVAQERIEKVKPNQTKEIIKTGHGTTKCYDYYTDRLFESDIDKIKEAVNELNAQMLEDGYVSLNDFYYALGLHSAGLGQNVGWSYNRDRLVKLSLSSQLDDGVPVMVVDFQTAPYYGYEKY